MCEGIFFCRYGAEVDYFNENFMVCSRRTVNTNTMTKVLMHRFTSKLDWATAKAALSVSTAHRWHEHSNGNTGRQVRPHETDGPVVVEVYGPWDRRPFGREVIV
jgi:hypothetical protein